MAISILEQPSQTTTTKADTYDRILSQLSLLQRGHENIHITYNANTNTAILKDGSSYEVNGVMYVNEGDLTLPTNPDFNSQDSSDRMYGIATDGTTFLWDDITGSNFNLSSISSKGGWYRDDNIRLFSSFVFIKKLTNIALSNTLSLPIGAKVLRYRTQTEPNIAGYLGTWENKSSEHAARFFRCEGSETVQHTLAGATDYSATPFGNEQDDMMIDFSKDASGVNSHFPTLTQSGNRTFRGVYSPTSAGSVAQTGTIVLAGRAVLDLSQNVDSYRLGHEMRPLNETVQIWERIA